MQATPEFWRRCSSCKNPIGYQSQYYECSVSTCTRKRVGYVFCSVHCWERHLPGARHRDAAAVEARSPSFEQWRRELEADGSAPSTSALASATTSTASSVPVRAPQKVIVRDPSASASGTPAAAHRPSRLDPLENEILVVVSKMKNYIRERADMSTSDSVMHLLSNQLRRLCDRAIEKAREDGRKTVMDRDF